MKLGLLVSGALGLKIFEDLMTAHTISFVLTDKASSEIRELAESNRIPLFVGNPRGKKVLASLKNPACDVILSINYLFIVTEEIFNHPRFGAINFHGSLLPKYRGRTPHVWAIINNETETGITAHFIDKGCDTGDIVKQVRMALPEEATGASILEKFKKLYPVLVGEVLEKLKTGSLKRSPQVHDRATYYGKREPKDGLIDWDWQKERIYNWVRALSYPYPGAFSYINGIKIIINKIEFSEKGFSADDANGIVLFKENLQPIIKTSNGSIKLIDYIFDGYIEIGQVLK